MMSRPTTARSRFVGCCATFAPRRNQLCLWSGAPLVIPSLVHHTEYICRCGHHTSSTYVQPKTAKHAAGSHEVQVSAARVSLDTLSARSYHRVEFMNNGGSRRSACPAVALFTVYPCASWACLGVEPLRCLLLIGVPLLPVPASTATFREAPRCTTGPDLVGQVINVISSRGESVPILCQHSFHFNTMGDYAVFWRTLSQRASDCQTTLHARVASLGDG